MVSKPQNLIAKILFIHEWVGVINVDSEPIFTNTEERAARARVLNIIPFSVPIQPSCLHLMEDDLLVGDELFIETSPYKERSLLRTCLPSPVLTEFTTGTKQAFQCFVRHEGQ